MSDWRIIEGDCRERLAELPKRSAQTCVTSPPYFGLRDYGTGEWEGGDSACDHERQSAVSRASSGLDGATTTQGGTIAFRDVCGMCGARRVDRQIGLEAAPDEYVAGLVAVFREVRRVLRDDGTVWLNLGDSYAATGGNGAGRGDGATVGNTARELTGHGSTRPPVGCKPKDLLGIPWLVAFALRADGWYLRSDIIWAKPNPMPESVTDRPTKAHEYLFLLSKGPAYYYDADVIREPHLPADVENGRNKRSVWTVATHPYREAHFATFPPQLIEPCILAGCPARACEACGAPWQRVVENREPVPTVNAPGPAVDEYRRTITAGTAAQRRSHGASLARAAPRTLGFEPSCGCDAEPVPGVVLDPFNGAGTTGLVAIRNGRDYIGIELNPEYAAMTRRRLHGVPTPLPGMAA